MWPVNDDDMMSEETVLNPIGRSTLVGCFLAVTPCTCGLSCDDMMSEETVP